ncbi:MAG: hypothetical protein ACXAC7_21005 [Candidatus Hodarchaeales archaeon]
MRIPCNNCKGTGKVSKPQKCKTCKGYGSTKLSLSDVQFDSQGIKPKAVKGTECPDCNGTGTVDDPGFTCDRCKGSGEEYFCEICHNASDARNLLCRDCFSDPVVYELKQPLDFRALESMHAILGTVISFSQEGYLIDLGCGLEGVIPSHKIRNIRLEKGEQVPVMINADAPDFFEARNRRSKFSLTLLRIPDGIRYKTKPVRRNLRPLLIKRILSGSFDNKIVVLNAEVISIRQTSGPTSFSFLDEASDQISGVAFVKAGVRAFPEVYEGLVVTVIGKLTSHQGSPQLDILEMEKVSTANWQSFKDAVEKRINAKSAVEPNFKFLVESPTLEKLKPEMIKVAQRIRKALLTNQQILLRYHHPCVDGAAAGVALELAILGLLEKSWEEDTRGILKKFPERDPTYSIQDATRDLLSSLEEEKRYGYHLPLVVLLDFGSSQSQISFELLSKGYNLEVIVIDHHVIEPGVGENLFSHINPNYHTSDYSLATGMLSVELARMIYPNPKFSKSITHLAAIAGRADRVEGTEIEQYLGLTTETVEEIDQIVNALKYTTYNLRFSDGSLLLYELLSVDDRKYHRQKQLISVLAPKAEELMKKALDSASQNAVKETLSDGTIFTNFDLTKFVQKGTYPPAGKVTGALHDSLIGDENSKAVTLGFGFNFLIYRNTNYNLRITDIINSLKEKFPAASVDDGGHDRIGTIRFLAGYQSQIIEFVCDLIKQNNSKSED